MKITNIKHINRDESGLVAIMVTLFFILIISLIVLTFARIIRREERQTLDRQLETQAFYAAETGINDAKAAINNTSENYKGPKPNCPPLTGATDPIELKDNVVDSAHNVSYPCLTIDTTPTSLFYPNVRDGASTIIPVGGKSKTGNPISNLTISWHTKGDNTYTAKCGYSPNSNTFKPHDTWSSAMCVTGLLRMDLVKLSASGSVPNRATLLSTGDNVTFFYPVDPSDASGVTNVSIASLGTKGTIVPVTCSLANKGCSITLNGLGFNAKGGYLRLMSVYLNSSVTITATDSGGAAIKLAGAQALIDSTGKANDILKRVEARLPLYNALAPDYAIQSSNTICKLLRVTDDGTIKSADYYPNGIPAGVDTDSCQIQP